MIDKLDCKVSSKNGSLSLDCFVKKRMGFFVILVLFVLFSLLGYYLYKKITQRKVIYLSNNVPVQTPKPSLPSDLSTISFLKNPLTDQDIKSLTTEQILSLTSNQLKLLSPEHFALFSPKSIRGIDHENEKNWGKLDILCQNSEKKNLNLALITKCLQYSVVGY
jgi:hypothetical protein